MRGSNSKRRTEELSTSKFITGSVLLFIDQTVIAVGGWIYWLLISKLTPLQDVGLATAIFSLVGLVGTLTGLGLEYPILKRSHNQRSEILVTALVIELAATIGTLPFVIYFIDNFYRTTQSLTLIAIGMLISNPVLSVTRFALLGVSDTKTVLAIDIIAIGVKFAAGYILVLMQFGAFGILISFLLFNLVLAVFCTSIAIKRHRFGLKEIRSIRQTISAGIVNMPSILSRTIILTLSVVLLASLGVGSTDIGIFYIALMISLFGAGFVSSSAYMVIPASSMSKTDLSSGSMRIGLSLTSPIIAALISSPKAILSLVGAQYISGETMLLVLSIGILPFSIVMTTISKFNYLGQSKRLVMIGIVQIMTFLLFFFLLTPQYKGLGASVSILIAYITSSIPAVIWSERSLIRYIFVSGIAITVGWAVGYGTGNTVGHLAAMVAAAFVTLVMIIALRNTSISELRQLLTVMIKDGEGGRMPD
jgi:O-antigen/teichoic acid export membrane protein